MEIEHATSTNDSYVSGGTRQMKISILKRGEAMNPASAKLECICQLFKDLNHLKPNSPQYDALAGKINTLSAEYDAMVGSPKKQK
jgi:hypothetical protein